MNRLLCALLLLAGPAFAGSPPASVSPEGVTKDGRYLVYSGVDGYDMPEKKVVLDLLYGTRAIYEAVEEGAQGPSLEDFNRWSAAHPTVELVPGRTSADKKSVADVEVQADEGGGAWVGPVWTNGDDTSWALTVTRAGKKSVVGHVSVASSVDVWWTPDGKRTLWVAHHGGHAMRDTGFDELVIATDGTPTVSLAVDKPKLKDAAKVAEKVAKAGFAVTSITPAAKPREQSVVYAAQGREAEAQKLAAAVPGGAQVAKLDWKSPFELVIALGPAAFP